MLDALKFSLSCLNLLVILIILGDFSRSLGLNGCLRVWLTTFGSGCSLGIGLGWRGRLGRSTLLVILLLIFFFGFFLNPSELSLLPQLLKLDLQIR